jgi:hypothetical protein
MAKRLKLITIITPGTNHMKNFKRSIAALAVTATLGISAPALANTGAIVGTATTVNGEVLSNTSITIKNINTGLTRVVTSEVDGSFRFPLLPPGTYSVTATKDGYETTVQDAVQVGISGKVSLDLSLLETGIERISVTGGVISLVDVTSSNTGIVVDSLTLEKVPVPRDLTGVALLAPGTTKGDSAFGNLPSIGGASVAENAYYVNGLNLTNFRTGVGSSQPPFEMYESFEVKTGGYSAEFGRATGGVINAKTKSGSNEFKWGFNAQIEPDALRSDKGSTKDSISGTYDANNTKDENTFWDANIWMSGALIEDELFFYTLFNPRSDVYYYAGAQADIGGGNTTSSEYEETDDSSFWGLKLDWYINDDNILEFTSFSDSTSIESTRFSFANGTLASPDTNIGYDDEGGLNWTLKYTSIITDDFSISAQYGVNQSDRTTRSAVDGNPVVYYNYPTTNSFEIQGDWSTFNIGEGDDKREVFRVDADWYLGDHELRFGIDNETLQANQVTLNSGGAYYLYYIDETTGLPDEVRHRTYSSGGSFESNNFAFYIQDQWQVTDQLVVNMGIRNDSFENLNGAGESFVTLDNLWAPRLGLVYDVTGDGESKIWASYGRYYLPVAANTNIRLSGAETYIQDYYEFDGFADEALGIPNLTGAVSRDQDVFSDGDVPDKGAIVDANIEPMFSDELIIGYQFQLTDEWSMAIQANYRELGVTIEDVAVDYGLNQYVEREFGSSCTECSGFHYYVLGNPGSDMTITTDPDGDGPLTEQAYTIPASDLNYPESIRKYTAVDVSFEKAWDGVWMFKAAYTWSKSEGNNEGSVRSDNGQDDAGLTTLFDQPGLLDGAYGSLPNDRTHALKAYGAYQIDENWNVGANFSYQSGRPKNAFGYHPTDVFARAYGSESFYKAGELAPRGSEGRTDAVTQIDLTASYNMKIGESDITFRADVFNVLDLNTVTETDEIYDLDGQAYDPANVLLNPDYGDATNWQTPRYVRLSVNYRY